MKLSFLDWVSLIANIVTILGISGFLTGYINKKREEKKTSNEVLANAIKSASLSLNLYQLDDKKIYRVTDYIRYLQDNLKKWKERITDFEIETDWQESEEYFLPSEEELFVDSSDFISDSDGYSTDYVFHDVEDQQWITEKQISEYLRHFKKFTENERENILRIAISRDILSQHLINIEGESRLSEEELSRFIDSILSSITSERLSYNSYLNKEFESLLEIQTEIDELLKYQELYVETIFQYIVKLDNPFVIFQEKWRSENNLPIEFSTEEYSTRRIVIVDKILSLFKKLEKSLPK
ncbi:hypothetical protein [Streptococcus suis]|uniref:hypothetical protein n=3 Tax=Streptococcus suis TaxID=1307 RepID=UPI0005CD2E47|nr:hypothetical protein [Streptococcus suis]NQS51916.1 hypothetical protein [Streptococcus suis]CYW70348.1 Uncharacterised protein [Streptococcus suis]